MRKYEISIKEMRREKNLRRTRIKSAQEGRGLPKEEKESVSSQRGNKSMKGNM